jgi:hypothetical protein
MESKCAAIDSDYDVVMLDLKLQNGRDSPFPMANLPRRLRAKAPVFNQSIVRD